MGSRDLAHRHGPDGGEDIRRESLSPLIGGTLAAPARSLRSNVGLGRLRERQGLPVSGLPLAAALARNVDLVSPDPRPLHVPQSASLREGDGGGTSQADPVLFVAQR